MKVAATMAGSPTTWEKFAGQEKYSPKYVSFREKPEKSTGQLRFARRRVSKANDHRKAGTGEGKRVNPRWEEREMKGAKEAKKQRAVSPRVV